MHHYEERSLSQGSEAAAVAYVEVAADFMPGTLYGVGIHANIVTASLLAVLSAVNRALRSLDSEAQGLLLQQVRWSGEFSGKSVEILARD